MATLALALFAGAALAAKDPCAPAFNFFPTATEIGEKLVVNNKTCTGSQVCSFPSVWAKANQSAYMAQLGTSLERGLLNVAFKQYGNELPRLFFTVDSGLLVGGEDVTTCAEAHKPVPPAARKMMQKHSVANAGEWSYTVSYDGGAPVTGKKTRGGAGQLDPKQLNKDGSHCAEIVVAITGASITPSVAQFPSAFTAAQKVCWYKISTQPRATFDFDMCTNKKFTVNVSDIYPLAQNLSQNGSAIKVDGNQEMLFRPVIHLFGNKNKSLDGSVIRELEYDNQNNPVNFINKYIVLPKNFSADDMLSFVLDQDQLDEGYYKLSAKIAMITQYPDIVELEGENRIVQADAYGEDVRGFTEFMGVTVVNETTMVGVQKSKTTISEISADRVGQPIAAGDAITFSWKFAGIGKEKCFHDGVELPECSSPMKVVANDVSKSEHKFRVEFVDVCGNTKDAEYAYTQSGVTPISQVDYLPGALGGNGRTRAANAALAAKIGRAHV